ncbi:hypothetical protein BOO69_16550 [Sulfitobacter alexandrii]|uniref:Uncharacterized protein n=1 Tax=Sulfitobacter alexandrii TaxID=1917485 RepID=A0A1J0WKX9_9RHOB|nr:hypothetical protein [Sulfitobacter alexandrii]APE44830.1 hypothetical protein BOO69_16550 [Sulfitobacter alexandrii]
MTLRVAEARMVLFAEVPLNEGRIALDITITTEPLEERDPDYPDDPPYLRHHDLTTQWLNIHRSDLRSRDAAALDGLVVDWQDDGGLDTEAPAAIYDGSYGTVDSFRLTLAYLDGDSYALQAEGRSEFDTGFAVTCTARLEKIVLRPAADVTRDETESALSSLFDLSGTWHDRGRAPHGWRDLSAAFDKENP